MEILSWAKLFVPHCPDNLPAAHSGKWRVLAKGKGTVCLEPPYDGGPAWYSDEGIEWPLGAKVRAKFVPGEVCGTGRLCLEVLDQSTTTVPAALSAFDNTLAAYNW